MNLSVKKLTARVAACILLMFTVALAFALPALAEGPDGQDTSASASASAVQSDSASTAGKSIGSGIAIGIAAGGGAIGTAAGRLVETGAGGLLTAGRAIVAGSAAPEDAAAGLSAGDIYLYCPTLP